MRNSFRWQGFTSVPINEIINDIKTSVSDAGGAVINFQENSEVNLSLNIELPEYKLLRLFKKLNSCLDMDDLDDNIVNSNNEEEVVVILNIAFRSGGDRGGSDEVDVQD